MSNTNSLFRSSWDCQIIDSRLQQKPPWSTKQEADDSNCLNVSKLVHPLQPQQGQQWQPRGRGAAGDGGWRLPCFLCPLVPPGHSREMGASQLEQPAPELHVQQRCVYSEDLLCVSQKTGVGEARRKCLSLWVAAELLGFVWGWPSVRQLLVCFLFVSSSICLVCCTQLTPLQQAGVCPGAGFFLSQATMQVIVEIIWILPSYGLWAQSD